MEHITEQTGFKRGTALLVTAAILIASTGIIVLVPRNFGMPTLNARVGVVDSGIDTDSQLFIRVIAEKSFIQTEFGYSVNYSDTVDSRPNGNQHGTYVAKIIATEAPDAAIVNAKVVTENNTATSYGIAAAIYWCVDEQDCDIINLSLGGSPTSNDVLKEAVEYAFEMGVTVVAAAGNNANDGLVGSSIESPAIYREVIGVAAIDETGQVYPFSGRGPIIERGLKPDIAALGYYSDGSSTLYGTSFATPHVSGIAAKIIEHCVQEGWSWTPGMLKALLLSSSEYLSAEVWEVGSGVVDFEAAIRWIDAIDKKDGLPMLAYVPSSIGPFDFEQWFVNTTVEIDIPVYCSSNGDFAIWVEGTLAEYLEWPSVVSINQTGSVKARIFVGSNQSQYSIQGRITFSANGYRDVWTQTLFDAEVPDAWVAFDVSHTPWWIDSIFGQFRSFYQEITAHNIAVEEIYENDDITLENLERFDAIAILDPCAWDYSMDDSDQVVLSSERYGFYERNEIRKYVNSGGSVFIAGLDNRSIDIAHANDLLSIFGAAYNYDRVPSISIAINGVASTHLVTNITDHPITTDIASFDYYGCSVNISEDATPLAWAKTWWRDESGNSRSMQRCVLAGQEHSSGARTVITGTNFFIDNFALNGEYKSSYNNKLALQIVLWLVGSI